MVVEKPFLKPSSVAVHTTHTCGRGQIEVCYAWQGLTANVRSCYAQINLLNLWF